LTIASSWKTSTMDNIAINRLVKKPPRVAGMLENSLAPGPADGA